MNVGITQRLEKVEFYEEWRDALDQRLIDWVVDLGCIPIPIPNTLVDANLPNNSQTVINNWLNAVSIDALLLSGGNDIGARSQRDFTEKYLLSWAKQNRKPVLGICRGMQMMGVYAGGKLIKVNGHVRTQHRLQIPDDHEQILPEFVNSFHNLVLQKCPDSFQILANSEDGNIEAITHKELPWEAWMWHPEREDNFAKIDQERFKKLMNNGKQ